MSARAERIYTAAVVIIGNEVLSGRVRDANLPFLARELKALGIRLREARVIADRREAIVEALRALCPRHDYVFTTGGIGPTHDDVTAEAVAAAFGVELVRNPEAVAILERHYGDEINPARLRMANTPAGAELLDNPVSRAPGFRVENCYVLPGVPRILQAIFDGFKHRLAGGAVLASRTVTAELAESLVAEGLAAVQERHPEAEIGSYPHLRRGRFATAVVVRAADPGLLEAASAEVVELLRGLGAEPEVSEGEERTPEGGGES